MRWLSSGLALVRSLTESSATGVFIPPQSTNEPYDATTFVNTMAAVEVSRDLRGEYTGGYMFGGPES